MSEPLMLSVVIPARDEEHSHPETVAELDAVLEREKIPHEILVVDDHSRDETRRTLEGLSKRFPRVRWIESREPGGFGNAVRAGLDGAKGDAVCVYMADASDDPEDAVAYYRKLREGHDCVFGSRFMRGGRVTGYPPHKLVLNRLANWFIMALFGIRYNDVTNAFKCYRRGVLEGVRPLFSRHFNLTVELPLKAIIRGYSYAVVPIRWRGREKGFSKLRIREMGSRYLFIVAYAFLEKVLSRGDYKKSNPPLPSVPPVRPSSGKER